MWLAQPGTEASPWVSMHRFNTKKLNYMTYYNYLNKLFIVVSVLFTAASCKKDFLK